MLISVFWQTGYRFSKTDIKPVIVFLLAFIAISKFNILSILQGGKFACLSVH